VKEREQKWREMETIEKNREKWNNVEKKKKDNKFLDEARINFNNF